MKFHTKGIMLFMVLVCMITLNVQGADIKVEDKRTKEIRIGLVKKYYELEKLTSYSENLSIGYAVEGTYLPETVFMNHESYTFTPVGDYFLRNKTPYKVYSKAVEHAKALQVLGYPAFPALAGYNKWYIYMGRYTGIDEAQDALNKANKSLNEYEFRLIENNDMRYKIEADNVTIAIVDGESDEGYPQFMGINETMTMDMGKNQYRGRMEIGIYGIASIGAINVLDMESYLYGVVPIETPYDWEAEAHKAQAVAARTFAYYNGFLKPKHSKDPYDLVDSTADQAYEGFGRERSNTNDAVDVTKGQVITYKGDVIEAFYFSTSGGSTEAPENYWSLPYPYLKSVSDIVETDYTEKDPWTFVNTKAELEQEFKDKNFDVGNIIDISITGYTSKGRVTEAVVIGSKGTFTLERKKIRELLGTRSTKFTIRKNNSEAPKMYTIGADNKVQPMTLKENALQVISGSDKKSKLGYTNSQVITVGASNLMNYTDVNPSKGAYLFIGMGNGHGIGMSQSGAQGMALNGSSYLEILKKYYTGVEIMNMFD